MPGIRIQYILGPIWGKTAPQLRKDVVLGNNPLTGEPVIQEILDKLTKPLTAEEKRTGEVIRDNGPETFTGTEDELQQMFLEKRYTDFLPIILPTKEKVDEMLAGTSHDPEEKLGEMSPFKPTFESWSYTVKIAAINAVMAGAKPEYFPVILAIGSTGAEAMDVSDNGFAAGVVINGTIRDEIGMNYNYGALGPYAHANTTIGRAWTLLSINGGNCGKVGNTYMGTVGNPMNGLNIIIAENEEKSPWDPLSVRIGRGEGMMTRPGMPAPKLENFKKGENVVTMFMGWGVLSAKNWYANVWGDKMDYPKIIKDIYSTQDGTLFGTCAVLSPPIANFVHDAGYDTVEKFTKWVKEAQGNAKSDGMYIQPPGGQFTVIVTGASNNNYFSMGGFRPGVSVRIDPWR
ncbi:MAG: hypothetical protein JW927_17500 [Deltaproteobacteria bacterium]|nr:hypothetical protein [Deltaproteobacteria bacterium]